MRELIGLFACCALGCSAAVPTPCPGSDAASGDSAVALLDAGSDANVIATTSCATPSDCDDTHWCSRTGCGFTLGTCEPRPLSCEGQWAPTCACSGHTYDSPCHARMAGVLIAAELIPCVSSACTAPCDAPSTCVDCGSAGPQCLRSGARCVH